jgi:hypothetical protein
MENGEKRSFLGNWYSRFINSPEPRMAGDSADEEKEVESII